MYSNKLFIALIYIKTTLEKNAVTLYLLTFGFSLTFGKLLSDNGERYDNKNQTT